MTPLLLAGRPAVALPYAEEALAREIAAARSVAMVISDDRMTGTGWQPVAVVGTPRLVADRDGELFSAELLDQELRKYPPARALADSVLLRREHWWYLPRLVITVEPAATGPVGARAGGTGELLAVATGDALLVDTVRVTAGTGSGLSLTSLAGGVLPDGPAVLLGHDFSAPDLERWTSWRWRGELVNGVMVVREEPGRTGLEPPLGLWQRWRRQQRLERACRRALAD